MSSLVSTPSFDSGPHRPSLGRAAAAGIARGLVSGLVATVAMSAVMLGAQKAGLLGRMPPRKISDRFLDIAGVRRQTPEPARRVLGALSHFAFGGACGAVFGLASEVYRERSGRAGRPPLLAGLAFGTAVWAVSYAGWVPALGVMPSPRFDRPGRQPSMVVAHWVYGAVLAKVLGRGSGVA